MKTAMLFVAVGSLALAGCAGLKSMSVLTPTPPYNGSVRVVLDRTEASGSPIFMATYDLINGYQRGGIFAPLNPSEEQLADIRSIAGSHGADIVAVTCGESGTIGQGRCSLKGYASRPLAAGPQGN
jgi:hypothetical protein